MRYIADLFNGVLEVGKYTHAASKLQDELGFFNDLIAARGMAARLRSMVMMLESAGRWGW